MENNLTTKRNKQLIHAATQENLECIILSERNQTQKLNTDITEKAKTSETENRSVTKSLRGQQEVIITN